MKHLGNIKYILQYYGIKYFIPRNSLYVVIEDSITIILPPFCIYSYSVYRYKNEADLGEKLGDFSKLSNTLIKAYEIKYLR